MNWYEVLGLIGTFLVSISMMMHNIKTLRIVNLLGCLAFGIYGIFLQSLSIILLNVFTMIVNIYHLYVLHKENSRQNTFDILFKDPQTDEYLKRFISFHAHEISRFFPSFDPSPETGTLVGSECFLLLRETLPVSLIAFRKNDEGEITILLDYAIPAFRDLKNGKFFFDTAVARIAKPGSVFNALAEVPAHGAYLRKLGFVEVFKDDKGSWFRKEVKN